MSATEFFIIVGVLAIITFGTFFWLVLQTIFTIWKGDLKASDSFEARLRKFVAVRKYPFLFFFGSFTILAIYWFSRIAMLSETAT